MAETIARGEAVRAAFRNALLLQRDQQNWKIGLTQAVVKQRRYAEAVTLAEELIGQDPSKPDFWLLQANAYIGMGKPLEAAKNYEILDRMGQATAPALNTLGDIYVNEKVWDVAVRAYSRAIELDPKQDPARPVRSVEILAMRGAGKQARDLMAKVRTELGSELDADALITLGQHHATEQDVARYIAQVERIARTNR